MTVSSLSSICFGFHPGVLRFPSGTGFFTGRSTVGGFGFGWATTHSGYVSVWRREADTQYSIISSLGLIIIEIVRSVRHQRSK